MKWFYQTWGQEVNDSPSKKDFFAEGQGFLEKAPKDRQDEARRVVCGFKDGGGNWDDFLHDSKEVKAEIASFVVQALGDTAQPSTGDFKAGSPNLKAKGSGCTLL